MHLGCSSLGQLARLREGVARQRISSWDRTGGNRDFFTLAPGQNLKIAEIKGAGCIRHIWMTLSSPASYVARRGVLQMWWDDESEASPSVEVPIGDFFGIGHGIFKNFWSLPLTMSPSEGRGLNCFFPMPFASSARISVSNETESPLVLYFYVDFETFDHLEEGYGRFHAQWRRERCTKGWGDSNRRFRLAPDVGGDIWNIGSGARSHETEGVRYAREVFATPNLSDAENYVILEAKGKGQYVGCHMDVDCVTREKNDWYGEGDDMIVIDDEPWPPRLHGTGTEDYFNTAYCPKDEFCTPYHGVTVYSGTDDWPWKGKNSFYRFHIEDPIYFERSIRVSIEHGHANHLGNDYSSTAYWYQTEPHADFPALPAVEERLPMTP